MAKVKLIKSSVHANDSGSLCVYESGDLVPFDIKRIFTVTAKKNEVRGNHAHKICTQLLVCVSGMIEISCDDGTDKSIHLLSNMGLGLLVPAGVWASEKYTRGGSVLMVLCDRPYESEDYIRDYSEYKKFLQLG